MKKRVLTVMTVLLAGCATTRSSATRVDGLEADAPSCPSFAELDGRVQAESDQLVSSAPSEALLSGAAALGRARRACARHAIGRFLELRELQGLPAVQAELDALARAFSRDELAQLMADALGSEAGALEPMVAEAYAHERRGPRQSLSAPPPKVELLLCAELADPCAALGCLVERQARQSELEARGRACLDSLRPEAPARRARATARVIEALRPQGSSGVLTEALLSLETLRRQLWPDALAAATAGQPILAAQLAAPFAVLDSSRAEADHLRSRAIAFHLELARAAAPHALAARLQRLLAARAGGPAEPPLKGEPGHWSTPRWACAWTAPSLPTPFDDVELRLIATCKKLGAPKRTQPEPSGTMATFELERSLEQEQVEGSVSATCAGRTFRKTFSLKAMILDSGGAERAEALSAELQALVATAERECTSLRAAQAEAGCETLSTMSAAEGEQRYAEAFVATGRWEPCFVEHFTRRYGVAPPQRVDFTR